MSVRCYAQYSIWVSFLTIGLLSGCGSSTPMGSVALDPALSEQSDDGEIVLNLDQPLDPMTTVARSAGDVIVVQPDADGNFFIQSSTFTSSTQFSLVGLINDSGSGLGSNFLATGSLRISYNRNQNQTIIILRGNGNTVRIRIRGGDLRGQIGLNNFITSLTTFCPLLRAGLTDPVQRLPPHWRVP
ncbi:MAG: hypothetical protein HC818_01090 [Synechococcaceae cyanobacterium RM1_1_27]|nr:hypothetical protein [Synechococcaceae cyanobacterium RM1_1_27]